jgi:hypothetical protein
LRPSASVPIRKTSSAWSRETAESSAIATACSGRLPMRWGPGDGSETRRSLGPARETRRSSFMAKSAVERRGLGRCRAGEGWARFALERSNDTPVPIRRILIVPARRRGRTGACPRPYSCRRCPSRSRRLGSPSCPRLHRSLPPPALRRTRRPPRGSRDGESSAEVSLLRAVSRSPAPRPRRRSEHRGDDPGRAT